MHKSYVDTLFFIHFPGHPGAWCLHLLRAVFRKQYHRGDAALVSYSNLSFPNGHWWGCTPPDPVTSRCFRSPCVVIQLCLLSYLTYKTICGVEQVSLCLFSIEIPQAGRLFRSVTSPGLATSLNMMVSERLTSWGSLQVTWGRLFSQSLPCGLLEITFTFDFLPFGPAPWISVCWLFFIHFVTVAHIVGYLFSWLFVFQCCFQKACNSRIAVPSMPAF